MAGNGQRGFGAGAPGDHGGDLGGVDLDLSVEVGALFGRQGAPIVHRLHERLALRRERAAFDVGEGGLVRRHQSRSGAGLDGHVAEGHATGHIQRLNPLAGVFDHVAGAAGGADAGYDSEREVLGVNAFGQTVLHRHAHVLGRFLQDGLGGEHVLDLRGADAERQGAHGAVGGGVAVAADDGHAGKRQPLLRSDDVHDALARVFDGDVGHGEVGDILLKGFELQDAVRLRPHAPRRSRHIVVGHGDGRVRPAHPATGDAQPLERLGAGDFVHEVAVDVEDGRAVGQGFDNVGVPDLVEQGAGVGHGHILPSRPKGEGSRVGVIALRGEGSRRRRAAPPSVLCGNDGAFTPIPGPSPLEGEGSGHALIASGSRRSRLTRSLLRAWT